MHWSSHCARLNSQWLMHTLNLKWVNPSIPTKIAIKCQCPQFLTQTCVLKVNQTHLSTPMRAQTHLQTHRKLWKTLSSALLHQIKTAFLSKTPLVVVRPHAVTAHQSSVGGQSFDYLLHVTACVCREALGPGQASQPPQPLSFYYYPFH